MSNMSYCRFQNTLADLYDCKRELQHPETPVNELSREEMIARDGLLMMCKNIADEFEDEIEDLFQP